MERLIRALRPAGHAEIRDLADCYASANLAVPVEVFLPIGDVTDETRHACSMTRAYSRDDGENLSAHSPAPSKVRNPRPAPSRAPTSASTPEHPTREFR